MTTGWKEYDEIIDTATDELEAEDDLLSQVLTTHREAFGPDPEAGSSTEKFMAELLENAPNLNIRELMIGETYVDWDDGYFRFEGMYDAEELVAVLADNDLFVERGRAVHDNFLAAAGRYSQVTEEYFGGELWEEQELNNELGRNFRLRNDFATAQPHVILPALQEHDELAFNRVMSIVPPAERGGVTNNAIDLVVREREKFREEPEPQPDVEEPFDPQRPRPTIPRTPRPRPSVPPTWPGAGEALVDGRPPVSADEQRAVFEQQTRSGAHPLTGATGTKEDAEPNVGAQIQALLDLGLTLDQAVAALGTTTAPSDGPGRPSLAQVQAADRAEVEEFLRTQFGGFEFFLNKHAAELQVGITADGAITTTDDPSAITAKNVLDVIVEQGLTDPSRIEGALSNTQWWKDTDAQARVFDVTYANMNDLERLEYVEPTMDLIREELQFLGAEMSNADRQELAADLMRLGDQADTETVRDMLIDRLGSFDPGAASISDFAAARDEIEAMSRQYFVPIDTATAGGYAEDIYLGRRSVTEMEQYFKEHALSKFPTLENAIKNGFTPQEYFAPYKYEIEKMLGRPNINLYDEFADVIEYFPDTGGDAPRPMTMHEVRKYVRGLPEWQESDAGKASAEALAFAIGKTFGEVA